MLQSFNLDFLNTRVILKLLAYPIVTTIPVVESTTKAGEGGKNTFGSEHLRLFEMVRLQ